MIVRESDVRMLRDILLSIAIGRLQERTYRNVALLAQFPYETYQDRKYFARVLGKISEDEHAVGAPLLSALIVHRGDDQLPGFGFYDLAVELGVLSANSSNRARETFLTNEISKIAQYWQSNDIVRELEALPVDSLNLVGSSEYGYNTLGYVSQRRGQERFRASVLAMWANECAVTGYSGTNILIRASHIKSWTESDPNEKLDKYNGLPLIPNLDTAFDNYLISFDSDGSIIISRRLRNTELLGIHPEMKLRSKFKKEVHGKYLEVHRARLAQLDYITE